jgi:hypothetical protein
MQHKQSSVLTGPKDWAFASPEKHRKLPRSYTSFWEKLGRACHDAGIVHVSPHSFRHSYRAWLDELGTPVTVQQRAMRHGDIRVTMNYGDAVGDGLREASAEVAARAIPQGTARKWHGTTPKPLNHWGGRRESNLPLNVKQRTSQRTESNPSPRKCMKDEKMDLCGFVNRLPK